MKISRKLNANQREACSKRVGAYDEQKIKALVDANATNMAIAAATGFSRLTIAAVRKRLALSQAKNGRPVIKP